ncbi:MAG TPA: hypothetical protein VI299_17990 [Polyangiales bacterium]
MVTLVFLLGSAHAVQPLPAPDRPDPLASLMRSAPDEPPWYGRVEQRISAGRYTYLALRTAHHQLRWTVTTGRGAAEGAQVRVQSLGYSPSFYSKRLQRAFPNLVFGVVHAMD